MRPLVDKRILITRTRHQASEFAAQLEVLGARPILIPTIEIVPPESYAALDDAIAQLSAYDWLIFTSANAVEVFGQRHARLVHRGQSGLQEKTSATRKPRIAAIGPATARAVQAIGLTVDLVPLQYVAESLAQTLAPYAADANVLLVRAAKARDLLPGRLAAAGARVTIVDAYRNQTPSGAIPALQAVFALPERHPDAITFTSASTVRNLFELLEAGNLELSPGIALTSIGPITSEALRELGHTPTVEAEMPTIPALIAALAAWFSLK